MSHPAPPSAEELHGSAGVARVGRRGFIASGGGALAWVLLSGLPFAPRSTTNPGIESVRLRLVGTGGYSAAGVPATVGAGWSTRVTLPIPGQMVTLGWQGPRHASFELRSHLPGRGWSEWARADSHDGEGPDRGGAESVAPPNVGPIWIGSGTDVVELRVLAGRLTQLELETLRSRSSTGGWFGLPLASAAPAFPGIQPRSAWGAGPWVSTNGDCKPEPIRPARLRMAILHHTVSSNTYSPAEAQDLIRGIYHHHVNNNGWCDVAYNFFVDRFGNIYEGRTSSLDAPVVGGHASGFNTGSVGVALLGQHHPGASPPAVGVSDEARAALRRLLGWLFAEYGIDAGAGIWFSSLGNDRFPEGTPVNLGTITTHRDVAVTACPGENTMGLLTGLRSEVQRDVALDQPTKSRWVPQETGPALMALDAFGGVHAAGSAAQPSPQSPYWKGWRIARGIVTEDDGSGYVLDANGGLHPFGGAPRLPSGIRRDGQDAMRGVVRGPSPHSGYVLERTGDLHPFGGAPPIWVTGRWPAEWDVAVAAAANSTGMGGYVLDAFGGLHRWGNAPPASGITGYWPNWRVARGLALRPDGVSGWVLDAFGGLHPFGGAPGVESPWYTPWEDRYRAAVASAGGSGGWTLDKDGYIFAFGDAEPITHLMTFTGLGVAIALAASPTDRGVVS